MRYQIQRGRHIVVPGASVKNEAVRCKQGNGIEHEARNSEEDEEKWI
jgi:hypothetical protein